MSAVTSRERRATAGKRMSSLVGKAQEDDDAFWSHETWAEDDSGNDSFRESDEDSEARVDEFDSDFDDSESDHDAEEEAAGAAAEAELHREERSQKRKQKFDVARAGRDLMQKKKGKGKKRAMGDGINAGLVLNFPPAAGGAAVAPPAVAVPSAPVATKAKKAPRRRLSPRSPTGKKRSLRAATVTKSQEAESKRKATAAATTTTTTATTKKKQKRFTQEELLLEAATVTEPENERWLLARKRIQQTEDALDKGKQEDKRGKVISKFRSRRGCLDTLTFSEMDHVPDVLARKHAAPKKPNVPTECVITGKKARYRDPKTMLGYHDAASFKELRRRFNAGEPLDQRKTTKKSVAQTDVIMVDSKQNGPGSVESSQQHVVSVDSSSTTKTGEAKNQADKKKPPPQPSTRADSSKEKAVALMISKPSSTISSARSSSSGRSSPRKRKPSAKAMAAVETELIAPGKAPISNVILKMTVPELDAAGATNSQARMEEMNGGVPSGSVETKTNGTMAKPGVNLDTNKGSAMKPSNQPSATSMNRASTSETTETNGAQHTTHVQQSQPQR